MDKITLHTFQSCLFDTLQRRIIKTHPMVVSYPDAVVTEVEHFICQAEEAFFSSLTQISMQHLSQLSAAYVLGVNRGKEAKPA